MRTDPRLLDPEIYPLAFSLRILFGDMDVLGHVNNNAMARWFEEGRVDLNRRIFRIGDAPPEEGRQVLVARTVIHYLAQCHYPGEVTVASGLAHVGTTSVTLRQAVFRERDCIALAEPVLVKARHGRPWPIDEAERAAAFSLRLRLPEGETLPPL